MDIKPLDEITGFLKTYSVPLGIEIVDVVWNDKTSTLEILIETEAGVDLDTCEKFHNAIMLPIDDLDPTFGKPYTLNVSSPGLDRPFKTENDYKRNLGKDVEIKLYAPLKGKKYLEGTLLDFDGNSVTISVRDGEVKIPLNKIAKINKAIKFE